MALLHFDPLPRNATAGELLRFICDNGGLDGKQVGKIAFQPRGATAEVPDSHAPKLVAKLDGHAFRERRVRVRFAEPPATDSDFAPHFRHLAKMLSLEAAEERRRLTQQAKEDRDPTDDPFGTSLRNLLVTAEDYGLGGRLLLTFAKKGGGELPPNRLGSGSPVLLTEQTSHRPVALRGVTVERTDRTVVVAFEEPDDELPGDSAWRLDLSPDEASRKRQLGALYRAEAATKDRLAELRDFLLSTPTPADVPDPPPPPEIGTLNPSQRAAVAFALAAPDAACIHGPPGTGKTTAVVELIRLAVARGEVVLATAPSNAAVDNLLEKLVAVGLEPVRIGHPARVAPAVRDRTLDILAESHPDARRAKKLTREAYALFRKADKWTKDRPDPGEKKALRNEAKDLLAEARKAEQNAVDRVLDDARVICGTLTGIDSETLGPRRFGLVVIDEACQTTEPASWIPLSRADRVVFAGDPCQLPPTVLSAEAARGKLGVSLMEAVMARHGASISRLLTEQYRMHALIQDFSSGTFYGGKLVPAPAVAGHLLTGLPDVTADPLTTTPVRFLDTAGAGYDEELDEDTGSRFNKQEADLAAAQVRKLVALGVPPAGIAVITPYSAQVRVLRDKLTGVGVEIDSVDGFQGREKEAVVISFVRSNPEGQVGFLADVRRTNVALTRARRAVVVIGDSATLAAHPFYSELLTYFELIGAYGTVWELEG